MCIAATVMLEESACILCQLFVAVDVLCNDQSV